MKQIKKITTYDEYVNSKKNKDEIIINNKIIKEIHDLKNNKNIVGIYINDYSNIIDTIAFIKYYKFKKVIVGNINIEDIIKIIELIDNDISIEIEVTNTLNDNDINYIYKYISSTNKDIGIYFKMINDDNSKIFKAFRSFIKTIDIENCFNKDKCLDDSKIIHFDGNVIGYSGFINKKERKNDMTFNKLINNNLCNNGNKELFTFIDFDTKTEVNYTYKEFNDKVNEIAKSLINLGIKKGSHVALWMNSIEEWFIYFYAITKIGAIAIPINKDNREFDMKHILRTNDVNLLVMSNGHENNCYMDTMKRLIPEINNGIVKSKNFPHLKNIITIGFSQIGCISHENFIKLGKSISNEQLNNLSNQVYNDDIAIILPTSGTTGTPKGVMLTHESIIQNGTYIGDNLELNENDIMGIIVTMFHCFGVTLSMTAAMTHSSKMVIPAFYRPYNTIEMIHKYNITCLNGAPKHFEGLIESYNIFIDKTNCRIKSLKKGIMAGANCSSKLMEAVDKIFGMNIISVYGQTELAPGDIMSSISDNEYIRHNTVGRKFNYVDIKIVDDKNNEVPNGEMGEIVVKSPNVMVGYYGDYNSTQEMFDENGYFHSGDLAIKDDNFYKIIDRKKNIIIRNGENIQPMEVEDAMQTIDGVSKVCVFGINIDESKNQAVVAAVVRDNLNITSESIIKELKNKIARYKIPCKIYFVNDLEYNANGKIVINDQINACKKIEAQKLVKILKLAAKNR